MRAVTVLAVLAGSAATAGAYPQFQLSTGAARCNQCHYAPAGGGLINGYGREEAGDTISMGGDGAFLHGLWTPPSWLALGGDGRTAGLLNNVGADEGAELAVFPMQADLYARVQVGPISLYVTGGVRGAVRPDEDTVLSRLISREHYLMWRPKSIGPYVRAGRFFAPYGLRLAEHPMYVRRFLGFNTLEETYNVSGGFVSDAWDLHVTAFTPDFIRPVGHRGSGGAAYVERRLGSIAAAGAEARVAVGSGETRAQGGLVGKFLLAGPKLLLLSQVDIVHDSFEDLDMPRLQLAGYLGASWMFERGFMAQLTLERWDPDLSVKGVARDAAGLQLQWFPTAHVEVSLYGRLQLIGAGTDDGDPSQLLLLQGHYYL
jgi:hypothetical protein